LQILAGEALSGMSEARAALIFWFFFIKEKEHPPAALRAAHPAPHKERTPGLRRCCAPANDDYSCHFLLFI
jgi:hypothetical protein